MVRGLLTSIAATGLVLVPSASSADDYVGRTPPVVLGTEIVRAPGAPAGAPAKAAAQEAEAEPGDRIPITGGDIAGLAAMGIGSLAAGMALTRRARRHA